MDPIAARALSRRRLLAGVAGLTGAAAFPLTRWAAMAAAQDADGTPKPGGTLYIGQDFGPQDMDPTKTIAWASTNIEELIFTGLLRWTPEMAIEPDLATGYEMPDELTYIFTLRDGVTFHNGASFSAEDVKFTFDRILDPATASPHASVYASIESVEAVDPQTVKFTLSNPFAPFLRYLATIPYGAIIPKDAGEDFSQNPVGTGPFAFVQLDLDQQVVLKKHDGYYEDGLPYLDEVIFTLLGDDTSISSALRSETVQLTWLKDPRVAQNVAKTDERLLSKQGVSSRYIPIFFDLAAPPFDDVRVRRAMSLALDRQVLVDTVLAGYGSVGTFLPPSQLAGYVGDGSDLPYYTRDLDQAKALLEEAGFADLKIPEFKIVAANQLDVQLAQLMQQQWAEAGIDVQINPMEVGAILEDWAGGNYQMAMVGTVWTPDPNQEVYRFDSRGSFGQGMGIADSKVDELIDQGLAETDDEKRIAIYHELQNLILDQVYTIVPYTYPLRWELMWDYVKGYQVMPSNARLTVRETWLDQ